MLDLVGRDVISAEDLDIAVQEFRVAMGSCIIYASGDFGGWDILSKVYDPSDRDT